MLPDFLFLVLFFGCMAFYSLVVLIVSSLWPRTFVNSDPPVQLDDLRKIEREGFLWEEEFRRREFGGED